jgi:hypothetical protein
MVHGCHPGHLTMGMSPTECAGEKVSCRAACDEKHNNARCWRRLSRDNPPGEVGAVCSFWAIEGEFPTRRWITY